MNLRLAPGLLLIFLALGCAREKEPAEAASSGGSVGDAVVDVVTRRDAVEAGKRAKATIDAVQARRQQDFEEAMGETK